MSTWEPYPDAQPAPAPTPAPAAEVEYEAPPWLTPEVVQPEPTSQELALREERPPRLEYHERAAAALEANRRNRRRWRRPQIDYRASDGWENAAGSGAHLPASRPDEVRARVAKRLIGAAAAFAIIGALWFVLGTSGGPPFWAFIFVAVVLSWFSPKRRH